MKSLATAPQFAFSWDTNMSKSSGRIIAVNGRW
jgi:hypothetical protein